MKRFISTSLQPTKRSPHPSHPLWGPTSTVPQDASYRQGTPDGQVEPEWGEQLQWLPCQPRSQEASRPQGGPSPPRDRGQAWPGAERQAAPGQALSSSHPTGYQQLPPGRTWRRPCSWQATSPEKRGPPEGAHPPRRYSRRSAAAMLPSRPAGPLPLPPAGVAGPRRPRRRPLQEGRRRRRQHGRAPMGTGGGAACRPGGPGRGELRRGMYTASPARGPAAPTHSYPTRGRVRG